MKTMWWFLGAVLLHGDVSGCAKVAMAMEKENYDQLGFDDDDEKSV